MAEKPPCKGLDLTPTADLVSGCFLEGKPLNANNFIVESIRDTDIIGVNHPPTHDIKSSAAHIRR